MIGRAQITRRADREGVPVATVERDYVLAHVVAQLPPLGRSGLVFKGGTALRLCHVEGHRYSADLDFSLVDLDVATALTALAVAVEAARTHVGLERAAVVESGTLPSITYVGPLGRERRIKLDLADDELVEDVCEVGLLPVWDDLPRLGTVAVYTTSEILAEKLRCIMQRAQCRDLYDAYVLINDVGLDPADVADTFRRKARHRSLNPDELDTKLLRRLDSYRKRWHGACRVRRNGCAAVRNCRTERSPPPPGSESALSMPGPATRSSKSPDVGARRRRGYLVGIEPRDTPWTDHHLPLQLSSGSASQRIFPGADSRTASAAPPTAMTSPSRIVTGVGFPVPGLEKVMARSSSSQVISPERHTSGTTVPFAVVIATHRSPMSTGPLPPKAIRAIVGAGSSTTASGPKSASSEAHAPATMRPRASRPFVKRPRLASGSMSPTPTPRPIPVGTSRGCRRPA